MLRFQKSTVTVGIVLLYVGVGNKLLYKIQRHDILRAVEARTAAPTALNEPMQ